MWTNTAVSVLFPGSEDLGDDGPCGISVHVWRLEFMDECKFNNSLHDLNV